MLLLSFSEIGKGSTSVTLPLFRSPVSAGFPSFADDEVKTKIDLNQQLIPHPAATFLLRAVGESMLAAGIFPGDLLLVDRSLAAKVGDIVVACHQGEFLVKRLEKKQEQLVLVAENPNFTFSPLALDENTELWGVVAAVIRDYSTKRKSAAPHYV